jgi:REP element-mobilizing transposase RayT
MLRAARRLPSLRKPVVFFELRSALSETTRSWFRVVHFSVQADHLHLIVEADDAECLSRGLRGVAIRLARAVNRAMDRQGSVWSGRYHARALRTPRDVRNGLVYVLANWRKHQPSAKGFDPYSSAESFDGWKTPSPVLSALKPGAQVPGVSQLEAPMTWLLRAGWKRHGLLDPSEKPKDPAGSSRP